ncbi:DUF397 domain-containing protein [Streptomyces nitrosporeus]|uniref:DUF397 domain-containing protein n=1 Tax=Streptomyces nitrosporeus TaxID=28894 RepID=UPI0039A1B7AA
MTNQTPQWFTSSYSSNGGQCVEVAANLVARFGSVSVRDSKNPRGPVLDLSAASFVSFVGGVKTGGFGTL